jgi:hypothetical protein
MVKNVHLRILLLQKSKVVGHKVEALLESAQYFLVAGRLHFHPMTATTWMFLIVTV